MYGKYTNDICEDRCFGWTKDSSLVYVVFKAQVEMFLSKAAKNVILVINLSLHFVL